MNAKRIKTIHVGDKRIVYPALPHGYFYKNYFLTESQCFAWLKRDKEASSHKFENGTWKYEGNLFPSLRELCDWNEGEFKETAEEMKYRYQQYGIEHDPKSVTMYSFARDDWNTLYATKGEVLERLKGDLIEGVEEREERYLQSLRTLDQMERYFRMPIRQRIKELEFMI